MKADKKLAAAMLIVLLGASVAAACECGEGVLRTVTPGKRMGHVTLGETRRTVREHLGPPARTFTLPGGRTSDLWRYGTRENGVNPPTLEVIYEKGQAVQVETTNREFVTTSDLGVYSGSGEWRKQMGLPQVATYTYRGKPRQRYHDWRRRGVAIETRLASPSGAAPGGNEEIQTVIVHRPGVPVIPDVNGKKAL